MKHIYSDIDKLLDIGIALSSETDSDKLFEKVLDAAMEVTNCDSGVLYILDDEEQLWIKVIISKSKNVRLLGADINSANFPPVPRSMQNVCSRAAITKMPINIPDISEDFYRDFP